MKLQLSKVAIIATLAFIGIGFAGTQQANAGGCPKFRCDDPNKCALPTGCSGHEGNFLVSNVLECANCDNVKKPGTNKCVGHMVYTSSEEIVFSCPGKEDKSCYIVRPFETTSTECG